MPLYDYGCPQCGVFEARHSMFEPNLKKCPTCGDKVQKLVSIPAFKKPADWGWAEANNGKGEFCTQIANDENDQTAYCRSIPEMVEKAKQRGFTKFNKVG